MSGYYTPFEDLEFVCSVCEKPMVKDQYYCCIDCFEADML